MNLNFEELSKLDIGKLLKRKEILVYFVIICVAFFTSRGIYAKQTALASSLKQELSELEQARRLELELNKLEEDFAKLQTDIPSGKISTVAMVDAITQLANARNIHISSLTPKSQIDRSLYWEYPFEIEMVADYRQGKGFLNDLENSRYLIRVNSLSVSLASSASANEAKRSKGRISISVISAKK